MIPERVERVSEACKEARSEIVHDELKDPRIGFITITAVELSVDLKKAKVWVSIYGTDEEGQRSLEVLKRAESHIRGELGKRLRLKYLPELAFKLDHTAEQSMRIERIIKEMKRD